MLLEALILLPTWLMGAIAVLVAVVLAIVSHLVVRRLVPPELLEATASVAGSLMGVVGTFYALLVGFVVVIIWTQFGDAGNQATQEANALVSLYRDAAAFPAANRQQIRAELRSYAQAVIDDEWPLMARGQSSPRVWSVIGNIWDAYLQVEPASERERAFYGESVSKLNDLASFRRTRLLESGDAVPTVLWAVLLVGGAVTIVFSYFLGLRHARSQLIMTALLAGTMASILFLIAVLDYPFTGDVAVGPDALLQAQAIFQQVGS